MAMTIAVYKINRETGARTDVQSKQTFLPGKTPELSLAYTRCKCPRCTTNRRTREAL